MEPTVTGLFAYISYGTLLVVGLIVLLLFGNRVPDMMRSLGRSVTEFKKGIDESKEGNGDSAEKPN